MLACETRSRPHLAVHRKGDREGNSRSDDETPARFDDRGQISDVFTRHLVHDVIRVDIESDGSRCGAFRQSRVRKETLVLYEHCNLHCEEILYGKKTTLTIGDSEGCVNAM